jgi:hypothetical protein
MNVQAFQFGEHLLVRLRATSSINRALRIAFLLDVSDSMAGARLDAVKRTLHAARPLWLPDDRVTVVTFGDEGRVCLHAHSMHDTDGFYAVVDNIHTNGCTNLSSGLEVLHGLGGQWDAVILLTDGQVNMGIMSTAGLYEMACGVGRQAYYAIGYGADHNRRLLRDLAIRTRGSYTYASADEMLPVCIGDVLSGLRTEVYSGVRVVAPTTYACAEYGSPATHTYEVGGMVADREYWAVFTGAHSAAPVMVESTTDIVYVPISMSGTDDEDVLHEQVLRARVAGVLATVADGIEDGLCDTSAVTQLKADMDALSASMRARPLVLRMMGQVAEAAAAAATATAAATTSRLSLQRNTHVVSAISSGAAYLSMQRGTSSAEDPDVFASPAQRTGSTTVRARFRRGSDA